MLASIYILWARKMDPIKKHQLQPSFLIYFLRSLRGRPYQNIAARAIIFPSASIKVHKILIKNASIQLSHGRSNGSILKHSQNRQHGFQQLESIYSSFINCVASSYNSVLKRKSARWIVRKKKNQKYISSIFFQSANAGNQQKTIQITDVSMHRLQVRIRNTASQIASSHDVRPRNVSCHVKNLISLSIDRLSHLVTNSAK